MQVLYAGTLATGESHAGITKSYLESYIRQMIQSNTRTVIHTHKHIRTDDMDHYCEAIL